MRPVRAVWLAATMLVGVATPAAAQSTQAATREVARFLELEQEVERCAVARDDACLSRRLSPGFRQIGPAQDEADRAAWLLRQGRRAGEVRDLEVRRFDGAALVSFVRVAPGSGAARFVVDVWDESTTMLNLRYEGAARRSMPPPTQDRRPTGR